MLQNFFDFIFVHLTEKVRLRPEFSPKFLSTLGPNPNRPEKPGPTYNSASAEDSTSFWFVENGPKSWPFFSFSFFFFGERLNFAENLRFFCVVQTHQTTNIFSNLCLSQAPLILFDGMENEKLKPQR